jgi:8-amino-7-oxononanoate synthase
LGTIAAIVEPGDLVFSDRLNHASLIDGCRIARAQTVIYSHNSIDELRNALKEQRHKSRRAFVVTDSVFSMDGDVCAIGPLLALADEFDFILILDEAHATGVYGERGGGIYEWGGIQSDRCIRIGTLSKAVGCSGGFVAGSACLIDWLTNFARPYIYSTAIPVPVANAAAVSVRQLITMNEERQQLRSKSIRLRQELRQRDWQIGGVDSPIVPIYLGTPEETLRLSEYLKTSGFFVPAIRPPTVPHGCSLLRISLNVAHTPNDLDGLIDALEQGRSAG